MGNEKFDEPLLGTKTQRSLSFILTSIIDSLVSISPIIDKQFLCTKVFCAAFLYLQFVFIIIWQKEIFEQAAHTMMVKLTRVSNVVNHVANCIESTNTTHLIINTNIRTKQQV